MLKVYFPKDAILGVVWQHLLEKDRDVFEVVGCYAVALKSKLFDIFAQKLLHFRRIIMVVQLFESFFEVFLHQGVCVLHTVYFGELEDLCVPHGSKKLLKLVKAIKIHCRVLGRIQKELREEQSNRWDQLADVFLTSENRFQKYYVINDHFFCPIVIIFEHLQLEV
jgi:hypothetical protein